MDGYQATIGKRDRRDYDGRALTDEAMHRILQAGRMTGTSSNSQPLRFIALRDAATKQELAKSHQGGAPFANAPFGVMVLKRKGSGDFDVGRAAQNMMVAAWSDGILSCPVGIRDEAVGRKVVGFPEDYEIGICVAFGYPAADQKATESRPRLSMDEIVHWERW